MLFDKVIALVCVPVMLFVKPLLLMFKHQNDPKPIAEIKKPLLEEEKTYVEGEMIEEAKPLSLEPVKILMPQAHGHEEFELSEVFVHQIIETIEFVLGNEKNKQFLKNSFINY